MEALVLQDVLNSKAYHKENSAVRFNNPAAYFQPFVDEMAKITDNISVSVGSPIININEDGSQNTAYGEVLVEGKLPFIEGHEWTVMAMYNLKGQVPRFKVATGAKVKACTNMCVWGAEDIVSVIMTDSLRPAYDAAIQYVQDVEYKKESYERTIRELTEQYLERAELNERLGTMLKLGTKDRDIGTSMIVAGARNLYDDKSRYTVDANGGTNAYNLFNACTQYITDSVALSQKPEKTLSLSQKLFSL